MADGSVGGAQGGLRLGELLREGGELLARCGLCGAASVIAVAGLLASQARYSPLSALEDHLRCTCGGRSGGLSRWAGEAPPPAGSARLYLFCA